MKHGSMAVHLRVKSTKHFAEQNLRLNGEEQVRVVQHPPPPSGALYRTTAPVRELSLRTGFQACMYKQRPDWIHHPEYTMELADLTTTSEACDHIVRELREEEGGTCVFS